MNEDYSVRELDSKFSSIMTELVAIREQTTKTNGRVNKLERNMIVAGCILATIVFLKFPEVIKAAQLFI